MPFDNTMRGTLDALFYAPRAKTVACGPKKSATLNLTKDTIITDTDFVGTFGKGGPSAAINQNGRIRLEVRNCTFRGLPTDTIKLRGDALIEDVAIGEQWAPPGSQAHCDCFTVYEAFAPITIRRVVVRRLLSGQPAGVNNVGRVVANGHTNPVANGTPVHFEDVLVYTDATASFLWHVGCRGAFQPAVSLIRVGISGLKASPAMLQKLAYPGSRFAEWDVWDVDGGGPIPVPQGVTVG